MASCNKGFVKFSSNSIQEFQMSCGLELRMGEWMDILITNLYTSHLQGMCKKNFEKVMFYFVLESYKRLMAKKFLSCHM